jgi:hypothetical protein
MTDNMSSVNLPAVAVVRCRVCSLRKGTLIGRTENAGFGSTEPRVSFVAGGVIRGLDIAGSLEVEVQLAA